MLTHNLKQGSEEWLKFREDKISGSCFAEVISETKETRMGLIRELVANKYSTQVKERYLTPEMARGTDEEKFAAQEYEDRFNTKLEVVGICQHEKYDWIVFSPDRYAKKRTKYVEFKCPDSKTMIKYMIDKKVPNVYRPQMLLGYIVNEKQKEADFVAYDARFKEYNHQMLVVQTKREDFKDEIEEAIKVKIPRFRKEWEEVESIYQNLIF